MNVGFVEALKLYNYDCFIFHDVDLLPEDDRNLYTCPEQPRHMSVAVDVLKYKWVNWSNRMNMIFLWKRTCCIRLLLAYCEGLQGKVPPVPEAVAQRHMGSGCEIPCICNISIKWRWVVSFIFELLYLWEQTEHKDKVERWTVFAPAASWIPFVRPRSATALTELP